MLLILDLGNCGHDFCGTEWINVISYRPRLREYLSSSGLLYGFSYSLLCSK